MDWKELLLAEEEARIIAKKLVPREKESFVSLETMKFRKIPVVDVRKTVEPFTTETVYEYYTPEGYCGIITKIATTYYLNDEVYFYVDGALYEPPIVRAIGVYPNTPVRVLVQFDNSIVWKVSNNSGEEKEYGILNEGYIALRKYKEDFIKVVLSGGL
ncbi:MAG: hypothetical protein JTT12_05540 [Candidatus Brockarchaeota archaeon]|nr:hypothetical protein [Candidatus Brockarchaeota archaeon]